MSSFDPSVTYFHLKDGPAEALVADESFWPSVMAGQRDLDGWLVAGYACEQTAASGSAEVHPAGDELHLCQSGAMSAVLEHETGEEVAGQCCVIPAGVWHRQRTREPSRVFTLTFGKGTEHRQARQGKS